ncbi:MAG: LysE family translocator [Desulfuromonadales bacterium]|nr:LysE family translocator [Desulfuromonadales bacterium]MDH3868373.1 LysE family translocator [Desulfuromonadales bacterium]MDH4023937.1 LysE family translocator [Desulfuromonadales bacterium]HKJ28778.1 LysE family translocator [Desulfuromonadales bacterium]
MLSIETFSAFFLASTLLAIAPGPDNVFVLTQSALHGKLSGLVVVFGLCTGLLVHTAAVTFGVAVIFQASTLAFTLLKIIGAGYLVYLALQIVRATPEQIRMQSDQQKCLGTLYRRGIIMNVTNPKVSIFFLAFLPQFADPGRGPISLQMVALGGIFITATILVFGAMALIGGALGEWLNRSERAQRVMNWTAGTIFVGLALKLVTAER